MVDLLFICLRARVWRPLLLKEWFLHAVGELEKGSPSRKSDSNQRQRLFVHMKYHPRGISAQQIRAAFDKTCGNFEGTKAAVKEITVAFSRAPNLKDELTSARFRSAMGDSEG